MRQGAPLRLSQYSNVNAKTFVSVQLFDFQFRFHVSAFCHKPHGSERESRESSRDVSAVSNSKRAQASALASLAVWCAATWRGNGRGPRIDILRMRRRRPKRSLHLSNPHSPLHLALQLCNFVEMPSPHLTLQL
eukprot:7390748-Prymnesium_polylepis.1